MMRHLITSSLFCCSLLFTGHSYAQSVAISQGDTTETLEGQKAKADEVFFDALKDRLHGDNAKAEELYKAFLEKQPNNATAYYELARLYAASSKTGMALTAIQKAVSLDPTNKWYKETEAGIDTATGKYEDAAKIYAALSDAEKRDEDYPLQAADFYRRAGKLDESLKYLDIAQARNLDGDDYILLAKMQLYLRQNDVEHAAGVVRELIKEDPKEGRYYQLLGELYDNNRMSDKALDVFNEAQTKIPDDPYVQMGLANHYERAGDTTRYRQYLIKAITNNKLETEVQLEQLKKYVQGMPSESAALAEALPLIRQLAMQDPNDADVQEFLGEVMELSNKNDSAVIAYKKALTLDPSDFNIWMRLMGNYLDKPYADSLIRYSEKAIKLFPSQAITHFYNGVGHINKGNFDKGIKAVSRAIDLQPDGNKEELSQMYSTLADAYYSNKQYSLSDAAFDKALNLAPENATTLNNYAYYLSERNVKLDQAEKMSQKSLEIRPNEATFLDTYAWILYKKGDYANARTQIEKAIEVGRETADGTLYDHYGNILFKLNEKSKAIDAWKTAKQKGSDDKQLDKKISEGNLYE